MKFLIGRTSPLPIRILGPNIRLKIKGLPKGLFPVGLSVKMLKAFLPSLILAT
jgi:hypothetical protein